MEQKDIYINLSKNCIPSNLAFAYRKEINSTIYECEKKARFFKKTEIMDKKDDIHQLSRVILKIKSLQVNKEILIDNDISLISNTLNKLDIYFQKNQKNITINQEEQNKLAEHFKKIDFDQLDLFDNHNEIKRPNLGIL